MPYSSTSELPQPVRDKYSEKCQRAYMHAFNSVHEDTGDEGRASAAGHSAAQDCEEKNKGMDAINGAIDALPATKFQIFSGILKASRSPDGRLRLHGVASSTTKDLHGDTMESSAIEDMERAANNNLTIFLNHSYEVPEDVAGSVETARMKTRGVNHIGDPNYDLDMDILINDANPRAVKAFEAIERGTKLGLSIGALIPEGGARKEKGGNYIIEHVELLETSLVGIPANPRSWIEYAAKSLRGVEKEAVTTQLGSPTLTLDGKNYKIEGQIDGIQLSNTLANSTADYSPADYTLINGTIGNVSTIGEGDGIVANVDPPITEAACPTCGKSKDNGGDCGDSYHKSAEPDVTDAQVTIIQIDTGDGSSSSDSSSTDTSAPQDGPGTNPDTGDEDFAASGDIDVTADSEPVLQGSVHAALQRMVDMLQDTTRELVDARSLISELTIARDALTRERDTATAERDVVLIETKRVFDNLANTPLMRRAVVIEAEHELETKFKGIYGEDFLKMLRSPKNG